VYFADFVVYSGIEKNAFGCGCFTGVNVGYDPKVAQFTEVV